MKYLKFFSLVLSSMFLLTACDNGGQVSSGSTSSGGTSSGGTQPTEKQITTYSEARALLDSFSPDNDPGPQFTAEEKEAQLKAGEEIAAQIRAACENGDKEFVIPPGDYRFQCVTGGVAPLVFQNLKRTEDDPFTISAYGATFWFNLNGVLLPNQNYALQFSGCSNIHVKGLTLDSDPRGAFEAEITSIDADKGQITVKPFAGTYVPSQADLNSINLAASQNYAPRIVPFKRNGHYLSCTYTMDGGWGPEYNFLNLEQSFKPVGDNELLLTFRHNKMLKTMETAEWQEAYGKEGILEVGDVITTVFHQTLAIYLYNCEKMVIEDLNNYIAKGIMCERYGYGDHQWINCKFIARPNTNNLLGGEETMNDSMQHGSTYEGLIMGRQTDDQFNLHAYWGYVESVDGDTVKFKGYTPATLKEGDEIVFLDAGSGEKLETRTVKKALGQKVILDQPLKRTDNIVAAFKGYQNENWVVRNSYFLECYQRTMYQTGPGLFENNVIERSGSTLNFDMVILSGNEGGTVDDIVVRNNLFLDACQSPSSTPSNAMIRQYVQGMSGQFSTAPAIENITIEGNLFLNIGGEVADISGNKNVTFNNNIIFNPLIRSNTVKPNSVGRQPIKIRMADKATVKGNYLFEQTAYAQNNATTGEKFVNANSSVASLDIADNTYKIDEGAALEQKVREVLKQEGKTVQQLLDEIFALVK